MFSRLDIQGRAGTKGSVNRVELAGEGRRGENTDGAKLGVVLIDVLSRRTHVVRIWELAMTGEVW